MFNEARPSSSRPMLSCEIVICEKGKVRSGGRVDTTPEALEVLAGSLQDSRLLVERLPQRHPWSEKTDAVAVRSGAAVADVVDGDDCEGVAPSR
jgi:hypothetical protein